MLPAPTDFSVWILLASLSNTEHSQESDGPASKRPSVLIECTLYSYAPHSAKMERNWSVLYPLGMRALPHWCLFIITTFFQTTTIFRVIKSKE